MKNIDELCTDNQLSLEDMPNIDLYMDQVIQLFEQAFQDYKRNDEEKVLTKTMINNYAKGKLFFPITNKKYTKEHLILIALIYQLKGTLSIHDIKWTLEKMNRKIEEDSFDIETFYKQYLSLTNESNHMFKKDIRDCAEEVQSVVNQIDDRDQEYLEKVLLITSFVSMSNLYRKAAEKIVDSMAPNKDSKK